MSLDPLNTEPKVITGYSTYTGSTGNEAIDDNTRIVETKAKREDRVEKSESLQQGVEMMGILDLDHPPLNAVDTSKIEGLNKTLEFIRGNPFLQLAFLSAFSAIMMEILNTEREIHYNEATIELRVRDMLYEMAKESGALAKALKDNEARELLVQAITSFVQAGISAVNFVQVSRSLGAATRDVDQEIHKQGENIKELEKDQGKKPSAADDLTTLRTDDNPTLITARKKLESMITRREQDIADRVRNYDIQAQTLAEVQKQAVSGVQSILVSTIKTDSGVKEQAQRILDGITQAMNKFSESSVQQRNNAQASHDKFVDFLRNFVEKINQQALLGKG